MSKKKHFRKKQKYIWCVVLVFSKLRNPFETYHAKAYLIFPKKSNPQLPMGKRNPRHPPTTHSALALVTELLEAVRLTLPVTMDWYPHGKPKNQWSMGVNSGLLEMVEQKWATGVK